MKKILVLLFIGVVSFSMNGQTKEEIKKDYTGPVFEFESDVIDYGEIAVNSDGNRVFKFTNVGKSPLIITNVKGSCGCTVPTKPEEPIMPGESGEIKVKYATNRIGPFSKTVTITSNAYEPTLVLKVKGRVLEQQTDELQKKKSIVSDTN
ncbi:DUF1573 domain-containing protein [Lutimonas sp.]|jgi:hypothetical protein|uniref:DUF1573 domain-containing protein n=1 Tax=Lutimonas sp. TaxID=1872403 RepID=UPI003C713FF5